MIAWLALSVACGGRSPSGASEYDAVAATPVAAVDSPSQTQVVAKWDAGQLTFGDIEARIGHELRAMEIEYRVQRYERLSQSLEALVDETLLQAEAEKRGFNTVEELLVSEVEEKTNEPTRDEIVAFYPEVQAQLGGATLAESRPLLRSELHQRAMADRYASYVQELRTAAHVDLQLPYPELPRIRVPIADDDPIRGDVDAPVTVVQFAEYQCYYCNKATPILRKLVESYPGEVRLVFKDFPLTGHSRAIPAAVAAHCAGEQEQYWAMNELILANQHAMGDSDFAGYARGLGLDVAAFDDCVLSGRHEAAILADLGVGRDAGVKATPTFFINGLVLSGAQPYERFAAIVDRELGR